MVKGTQTRQRPFQVILSLSCYSVCINSGLSSHLEIRFFSPPEEINIQFDSFQKRLQTLNKEHEQLGPIVQNSEVCRTAYSQIRSDSSFILNWVK